MSIDSEKTPLKSKLQRRELTLGTWLTLAHPAIAEIFSRAGFDWVAVDLEHSVIDLKEAEEMIRIISLHGVSPLVRLSGIDAVQIKRVLDAGAVGVIVPNVKSVADIETVVRFMNYPPIGERGVGLARAQAYGPGFRDYLDRFAENKVLILQIENVEAVQNIDALLSHPEVDGYILGPYDLSASMRIPGQFEHAKMREAIARVSRSGEIHGKPGGIHVIEPSPKELEKRISEGFRFIAYSLDFRMLDYGARSAFPIIVGK